MTFVQLSARLKNFLRGWLLVLDLKEGLVECATVCVKSVVILWVMLPCVTTPFIERWWSMAGLPCLVENLAPYSEAQTTDGRWSVFSTISQTFGPIGRIGQIKFWVSIWGIFGCTISILFGTVSTNFHQSVGCFTKKFAFQT